MGIATPFGGSDSWDVTCAFPIKANAEILGVFEFFSREVAALDETILETLHSLGSQVGQRIKRMEGEAQLFQAQKMDAIGRLAGGVAHDFNNNLTCILGLCDLLDMELPPGTGAGDDVAEIRAVAKRAALLTQQLLAFGRKQRGAPRVHDANELIVDGLKALRRIVGSEFGITASLCPTALPMRIDAGQFGQVLMNLVVNARDAMPHGGKIGSNCLAPT